MKAYDLAEILYSHKSEGATVHLDGSVNPYSLGYYVGGLYTPLVFDSVESVDRGEIAWWIGMHPAMLYGVWTDDETGKVYIDASQWAVHHGVAVALGRRRGELAVWDIKRGQEIRCDYSQESSEQELDEISEP